MPFYVALLSTGLNRCFGPTTSERLQTMKCRRWCNSTKWASWRLRSHRLLSLVNPILGKTAVVVVQGCTIPVPLTFSLLICGLNCSCEPTTTSPFLYASPFCSRGSHGSIPVIIVRVRRPPCQVVTMLFSRRLCTVSFVVYFLGSENEFKLDILPHQGSSDGSLLSHRLSAISAPGLWTWLGERAGEGYDLYWSPTNSSTQEGVIE